jgi:hypothetical protein
MQFGAWRTARRHNPGASPPSLPSSCSATRLHDVVVPHRAGHHVGRGRRLHHDVRRHGARDLLDLQQDARLRRQHGERVVRRPRQRGRGAEHLHVVLQRLHDGARRVLHRHVRRRAAVHGDVQRAVVAVRGVAQRARPVGAAQRRVHRGGVVRHHLPVVLEQERPVGVGVQAAHAHAAVPHVHRAHGRQRRQLLRRHQPPAQGVRVSGSGGLGAVKQARLGRRVGALCVQHRGRDDHALPAAQVRGRVVGGGGGGRHGERLVVADLRAREAGRAWGKAAVGEPHYTGARDSWTCPRMTTAHAATPPPPLTHVDPQRRGAAVVGDGHVQRLVAAGDVHCGRVGRQKGSAPSQWVRARVARRLGNSQTTAARSRLNTLRSPCVDRNA